ncbi:spermidine/putrescine transport system permease protein [Microcella putealis]|uniref:Spermidine/putrescine transport system permease protein n=1 Tax=Microcella putealis TaxID=337005 RepID=A0A4Q7LWR9_9MICO|nr:ABC transporter permease [Microcella putealis]RZS59141.1 spermidine/putrescine transport system permease protein [Microcella putealis]TQM24167.1 spermidine/putrescine transport system permease protein [Microcella putealis]
MAFTAFSAAEQKVDESARKRSPIALFLLLPGVLFLVLFFVTPLISLVLTSLQEPVPGGFFGEYRQALNWQNYVFVLETYGVQAARAFGYAALASLFALLIGFPLAYFIGITLRRFPLLQALALVLVIAPFFISFLLRTLAWKQIFAIEGPVAGLANAIGLLGPGESITGTAFSVVFGLTYNFIPFMTLPIYATLERLDLRLVEAGGDLYANPATVFRTVTLPLAAPGVISGTLLTFIPASGDYINASRDFLGSTETAMIGTVIEANFLVLQNYPAAAALSIVLMAVILVLVAIYVKRSGTEDLL